MKYRRHPRNDDAYEKEEKWFCERCETNTIVTKEIPIPTESEFKGERVVCYRCEQCGAHVTMPEQQLMTEREGELAWHERVLDEKEQELN
jgi:RNase P subunit RPR2